MCMCKCCEQHNTDLYMPVLCFKKTENINTNRLSRLPAALYGTDIYTCSE